jgi:transaldolase/glucose-6-phosphate isomerase
MNLEIVIPSNQLNHAIKQEIAKWENQHKFQHLWAKNPNLWSNQNENNWLGWLNLPLLSTNELTAIHSLASEILHEFHTIVLLGMGGSSLCPDMMSQIYCHDRQKHYPELLILDSTDPHQIRAIEEKCDLSKTLFIVSSKSGSTLESALLKEYFYTRLQQKMGENKAGNSFIAITDPGSDLDKQSKANYFRAIFYGNPSIGGRYSALSCFGIVPAILMGLEIHRFLQSAQLMYEKCHSLQNVDENPAIKLGIVLGVFANLGKNKLTLIISEKIKPFGAWLEQLVAESTGKFGKAIIPVDNELLETSDVYGEDRVFVYIHVTPTTENEQKAHKNNEEKLKQLADKGQPVIKISLSDNHDIAGEIYRWELATTVACSVMKVNPFDQPDVEYTKKRTKDIMKSTTVVIDSDDSIHPSVISSNNLTLYDYTIPKKNSSNLIESIKLFLNQLQPGDYFNLSAFIEMSAPNSDILQEIRILIRNTKKVATCLGFGPRFLHSTGQAHKGGPNTGVFLQLTTDYAENQKIPVLNTSFADVISAQAQADLEVLVKRSRRIIRINIANNVSEGLIELKNYVEKILVGSI